MKGSRDYLVAATLTSGLGSWIARAGDLSSGSAISRTVMTASPRERNLIDDDCRFQKDDPTGSSISLRYDVRPKVNNTEEMRVAYARPEGADRLGAAADRRDGAAFDWRGQAQALTVFMKIFVHWFVAIFGLVFVVHSVHGAIGDPSLLGGGATGEFPLVQEKSAAPLLISRNDWIGVRRAAGDLRDDIERVTNQKPALLDAVDSGPAVIIGTVGRSEVIDRLIADGKIDVNAIRGRWEAFIIATVEHPLPGVTQALVIAGSDKRGTIFGIYEISQQIGVSPWYWWDDLPPAHRNVLSIRPGLRIETGPAVKYRGFFLNDEFPDLTKWVQAKFDAVKKSANPLAPDNVANYGHEFYARIFEVMLRLRANYLWPAMWNNAFNEDDPENARRADEFGIVMGTSHQEPMLRAQKEWDWRYKATLGSWNYAKHPEVLESFWREGVRRNRNFESLITLRLRGADDTAMAPGGPEANRALLEKIVDVQRNILRAEVNADLTRVPQVWCLYKEVQEYYEHGMRVPDDVTLLWAGDNWGNIRRLPTATERKRSGGAGIYYHFDYHGGPRSYQWLNSSPLPKIWDQMSMAKDYGADRVWIVNVGHFKGYELPLEYFLDLAWDHTGRWGPENSHIFTQQWAEREFGPTHSTDIADIVAKYSKYNARRKPEMLAPDTYSLSDYREAETVVGDYVAIATRAEEVNRSLPENRRDAFFELVLLPVRAGALVNKLYLAAGRNALYAGQGRASSRAQAVEVRRLFQDYLGLIGQYNGDFAQGKWTHFMDQPVLGYTSWSDPPINTLDHLKLLEPTAPIAASLGVAVEGCATAASAEANLPPFDAFNRQRFFVDVFNRGQGSLPFTATTTDTWIQLSAYGGPLNEDQRIWVSVDWDQVPVGKASGSVKISAAGAKITVKVEALNPTEVTRANLQGFVEANGYVSIEPEHYTRSTTAGTNRWLRINDYGRTLSGMKAFAPVDAPSASPGKDSPCLEYRIYLFSTGDSEVTAITAPTLNFIPGRGVRYAASFDDEAPQVVTLVPAGYQAQNRNREWEKSVGDNAHYGRSKHHILATGYHILKIWMIDPAVVMQKIIVDFGGLKPSYLGPPESFRVAGPSRLSADQPMMRSDPNSHLAHAQLLEKAHAGGIDLYFLGDSITRRWGATDYPDFLANWNKNFHGWNAGDFGWGADTTQNIIWRVQNGELDGVNPKVIVLLAGTNNVGNTAGDEAKIADVTHGITTLVNLCREKAPRATIIVMGIFPRNDGPVVPTINRINENLAKLADGKSVRYLNINDQLADANGKLYDGLTLDRLHPTLKGYEIWAAALKPILTELLGPPAESDTAPPPTGDPSAQRK